YLGLNAALYEWAESYDSKDWDRLAGCIAPTMRIDYRSFLDKIWEAMPAAEYVAMASDPHVLGNPLLKTQHFIGSSKWEYVSETEAIGWHQLRVPHQRYTDESRKEVAIKGHAHGSNQHWYKKVDGVWKFAGLAPIIRWGEFDFEGVFASGRETFGEQEQIEEQVAIATGVSAEADGSEAEPKSKSTQAHSMGTEASPALNEDSGLARGSTRSDCTNTVESANPLNEPLVPEISEEVLAKQDASNREFAAPSPAKPIYTAEGSEKSIDTHSEGGQARLMQMAREDGKLLEMQVTEVQLAV
ncbi:MAG: hypothetical protein Q9195_009282, partial [Heterodermia aff. obscurata]